LIIKIVDYNGDYFFNKNMPSGQRRRVLSIRKLVSLGWRPEYSLELGLNKYYEWFKKNYN